MPEQVSTPGTDRVVRSHVGAHEFAFRKPSRGDLAEVWRRFAAKLVVSGIGTESDVLNAYDGGPLLWEARLEVGLVPRSAAASLGERAPTHWLAHEDNRPARVSFDQVDNDEFEAVCRALDEVFKKKPSPAMAPTGGSAAG